jgi:hypothetical protein
MCHSIYIRAVMVMMMAMATVTVMVMLERVITAIILR